MIAARLGKNAHPSDPWVLRWFRRKVLVQRTIILGNLGCPDRKLHMSGWNNGGE
jgi:hypothetical protein